MLEEPPSSHRGSGLPCVDISLVLLLCELLGGTCTHHSTVPMSPLWRVIKGQIHAAVHVSGVLGGSVAQQHIPGTDRILGQLC